MFSLHVMLCRALILCSAPCSKSCSIVEDGCFSDTSRHIIITVQHPIMMRQAPLVVETVTSDQPMPWKIGRFAWGTDTWAYNVSRYIENSPYSEARDVYHHS